MKFKPGDLVEILIPTMFGPKNSQGVVHTKNLTEGLISVSYGVPFIKPYYTGCDGESSLSGPILDFSPEFLNKIN